MLNGNQNKLDLFLNNFSAIKRYMPLRLGFSKTLMALMFALENQPVHIESVELVRELLDPQPLKKDAFCHAAELFIWSDLALSGRKDELSAKAEKAYEELREHRVGDAWVNGYLALQMAYGLSEEEFAEHAKYLQHFRKLLRLNHKIRIGRQAMILVSMLLISGVHEHQVLGRTERAFSFMKECCMPRMRYYTAALILALAEDVETAVDRYKRLGEACKAQGIAAFNRYSINSLAMLSLLPVRAEEIASELSEMGAYLRKQKSFGTMYTPEHTVAVLTGSIFSARYIEACENGQAHPPIDLSVEQLGLVQRVILAVADDVLRRAENSGG